MDLFRPYLWRLVFTILGLAAAVSCLLLGFWKTMLILLCCGIGYMAGILKDKNIKIVELLRALQNKR